MHAFHGDLLIGGTAIRNVNGLLDDQADVSDRNGDEVWSGRFTIDRCQEEDLELGRQYLLLLEDGRNREVMLVDIRPPETDEGELICEFADCRCPMPK